MKQNLNENDKIPGNQIGIPYRTNLANMRTTHN